MPRLLDPLRDFARRVWPVMRLRWALLGVLVFVAALPGVAALGLRVYENALVRRTEAEVTAQAAALAASIDAFWPGRPPAADPLAALRQDQVEVRVDRYEDNPSGIDLRTTPVLEERPAPRDCPGASPAPGGLSCPPDAAMLAVAERMVPAIRATKRTTLASILLLDRQGVVLNGRDLGRSLAHVPEVSAGLGGEATTVLRHNDSYRLRYPLEWVSRATDIRLHRVQPIRVDGQVVGAVLVSRSPSALFRGMWEDRGKIAAGTALIFLLLLGLTGVLARAIVRPIEKLSEATRALAEGRQVQPPRPTLEVVEIRILYDDFAAMAQAIARRSRYLRDFAASLSHEFKTPLAGIRGGIELLQDHGETMQPAERERFLGNMAGDAERLSRLVSRLMELAQADMRTSAEDARAALPPILARLADGMAGERFAVAIDAAADLPDAAMDGAALETVLATLIENARQAGAARLTITARAGAGQVTITLADDGPGIPPGDRERVFDPFFTSKRGSGGTGLGLPIARALVENARGTLDLAESEAGARFVLALPGV